MFSRVTARPDRLPVAVEHGGVAGKHIKPADLLHHAQPLTGNGSRLSF
jgi:hypothetical protein